MNAYDVMQEWDRASGRIPRTPEEYDKEVPALLKSDYETWKAGIESGNKDCIVEGMKAWGLPLEPLRPFEMDAHIETAERDNNIP